MKIKPKIQKMYNAFINKKKSQEGALKNLQM